MKTGNPKIARNLLKLKDEPWWARTTDPQIKSLLLYQLS